MRNTPIIVLFLILLLVKIFHASLNNLGRGDSGEMSLFFFDVGQGDSVLIRSPNSRYLLIDGGPDFLVDYLVDKMFPFNPCPISIFILSHSHSDHEKGLRRTHLRCNKSEFLSPEINELGKFNFDGLDIYILWPPDPSYVDEKDLNNSSLVVLIDYGDFEALFMGDLEHEIHQKLDAGLIKSLIDNGLDVYKFPHHGASNGLNQAFFELLSPKVTILSVGENTYGHPSPEVLLYLESTNTQILRTDKEGTIEIRVK